MSHRRYEQDTMNTMALIRLAGGGSRAITYTTLLARAGLSDYRQRLMRSLELFHTHRMLLSLSDFKDSEIKADVGLKAPLVDNLFTELKFEWIYDNQPALGTDTSDSQLTIGVNYSW